MVDHDMFSHTSSDGRTFDQRITAAGYAWSGAAENIAAGQTTVHSAIDGWIDSDGHCANLMSPGLQDVGLACVRGTAANRYSHYWTMDLAKPR